MATPMIVRKGKLYQINTPETGIHYYQVLALHPVAGSSTKWMFSVPQGEVICEDVDRDGVNAVDIAHAADFPSGVDPSLVIKFGDFGGVPTGPNLAKLTKKAKKVAVDFVNVGTKDDSVSMDKVVIAGFTWVAAEPRGGYAVGQPVVYDSSDSYVFAEAGTDLWTATLVKGLKKYLDGSLGFIERIPDGEVAGYAGSKREDFADPNATPRNNPSRDKKMESDDLRTLPVRYDHQGERWRDYPEAVAIMDSDDFGDWPLTGPRNALWRLKQLKRSGLTPLTQHQKWCERSKVGKTDRAKHEHECLAKVLDSAVSYDQLNACNLACIERVVKRRMLIEQAYKSGDHPNYDGAEYFEGDQEATDASFVDPKLTEHVAGKLRDQASIDKERRKAREEKELKKSKDKKDGK
eukprot:gnl/MRDRNA2_/MRDRNA2_86757_c1_seq1.p1 gnl/MRDRNA2_/MRDRNA2_86757_c1~~gnl/MRDRNA2_/MRDRNA2_86757_c1_seq1.p1  ORF type:complete len:406 (+),score=88.05 gnl/MRDRNA2_/MRDRNA2_86757_c1_seq1:297-1514(+)